MTQHTPGPWSIKPNDGSRDIHASDNHGRLARVEMRRSKSGNWSELEANASLIAAAPDMLAALRGLTDWAREHTSPRDANSPHDLLVAAMAAIRRTEP